VAVGSQEGILQFYDTNPNLLANFSAHTDSIECLKASPNQSFILSGSADSTVKIWNVDRGTVKYKGSYTSHNDSVESIDFYDDNYVISSSLDNTIHVWDMNTNQTINIIQTTLNGPVWSLKMIPSQNYLASGHADGSIVIWSNLIYFGDSIAMYTLSSHTNIVFDLELIESRQMLVSASWDSSIALWNLNNFTLISVLLGHTNKVMALLPITYGSYVNFLFSVSSDNSIVVWNLDTYSALTQWSNVSVGSYRAFEQLNETIVLSGSQADRTLSVWSLSAPYSSIQISSYNIGINITTLASAKC